MTIASAITILVLVWWFKTAITALINNALGIVNGYSRTAENHAKRMETFSAVDLQYANQEAEIRAKAQIKALKSSASNLPDL